MKCSAIKFLTISSATVSVTALLCFLLLAVTRAAAAADTQAATVPVTADRDGNEAARSWFTESILLDQRGRELKFYTDVLKDQVVVVNFIFTRCPGTCPVQTAKMSELYKELGGEMGKTVRFVSISVDPDNDTPAKLLEFADRYDVGDGWFFLTGEQESLDQVTRRLGAYNSLVEAHSPLFLLGNVSREHWVKMRPSASVATLAGEVRKLLAVDIEDG
ncbi:MAG: SCO family protein [Proteobacteria bacterium]|nr:SCO family protein [Pseudomonadota bacterium]